MSIFDPVLQVTGLHSGKAMVLRSKEIEVTFRASNSVSVFKTNGTPAVCGTENARRGARTHDRWIKSPSLYRLSQPGTHGRPPEGYLLVSQGLRGARVCSARPTIFLSVLSGDLSIPMRFFCTSTFFVAALLLYRFYNPNLEIYRYECMSTGQVGPLPGL